jgi:hypothetical protein
MATTYLNSPAGSGTDPQIATFSMWFKISAAVESDEMYLFSGGDGASNNSWLRIQGTDRELYFRNRTSGSNDCIIKTSARYRDLNGWYHVVLKLNSTLGTAADRATMYVNGQEVTSLASSTNMTQNNLFHMFGATTTHIGKRVNDGSTGQIGNFLASHIHFCDGYAYDASYFGSTDTTTGEWKINTNPNVTYGSRGFFILKDGNSVTDASPNTNNFTVAAGTLTKTEDNPSNVFATMNALDNYFASATFTNGNNTVNFNNTNERYLLGTMGFNSGKWYWEVKYDAKSGDTHSKIGIESIMKAYPNGYEADSYGYRSSNGKKVNGGTFTTYGDSYTVGDIVGVAVDLDNNKIYFSKNGTWQDSGNPASGASGTGAAFTVGTPSSGFYFPAVGKEDADTCQFSFNFGNGYFGTTAVSSAGTNASNNGIFEYDVPTGYTALSTKGLNL